MRSLDKKLGFRGACGAAGFDEQRLQPLVDVDQPYFGGLSLRDRNLASLLLGGNAVRLKLPRMNERKDDAALYKIRSDLLKEISRRRCRALNESVKTIEGYELDILAED